MTWFEALFLGILQGVAEFLPISSSGHIVIGKELLGIETYGVTFEVVVHTATALSIITVFWREIWKLLSACFKFRYSEEVRFMLMLLVSMVPVFVVGIFFKKQVETIFGSGLILVGIMLLLTAVLLLLSQWKPAKSSPLRYWDALIIGLSQAIAVLPGLSRSGATISTGLMLGKDRSTVAKFSFLMVLIPILGEAFLDLTKGGFTPQQSGVSVLSLTIGFIAAYLTGFAACSWMMTLVKQAKLWGFALYCAVVGCFCLLYSLFL
ncbi:MAG: undecaprenyl-diphosphate phosphatase [Prevotellaceae bacterium]|jgi:undecaprenyl-diphosphatase|nr:undecaprenyl-diphosphate phosphatase [Prevotellaceae bacterium]